MTKTTEDIKTQAHSNLSKYSSEALKKKLDAGTLFGNSKTIAEKILKERGVKLEQAPKGNNWVRPKTEAVPTDEVDDKEATFEAETSTTTSKKETSKKKVAPKVEKVPKKEVIKKEPKAKKEITSTITAEQSILIEKVVAEDISKSDKIRKLSKGGISISEISKITTLNAHYSFVHSTVKKMSKDVAEGK